MFSSGVLGLLVIGLVIGAVCAWAVVDRNALARERRARQEWDDLVSRYRQLDWELDEIWQQR